MLNLVCKQFRQVCNVIEFGGIMSCETSLSYLKWHNEIIGRIDASGQVSFLAPQFNETVSLYTNGKTEWTFEQFSGFLSERLVSRDRRDIEKILFRCGLSFYDTLRIAEITRAIHPKDLLWASISADERFEDAITSVFDSVFHQKLDLVGESINTPEGANIKRYGVYGGQYGIYKKRLSPLITDVESEIAVYHLAEALGVPCCPAKRVDKDNIFSAFLYDFSKEYVVHFRRLFDGARGSNEYQNLLSVRPKFKDSIAKMILLDFITRQDDRHLSNFAIKLSGGEESFYPLYDNGRSLFYEDTEEMVAQAVKDPKAYATTFGHIDTYWDYACEIANDYGSIKELINLDVDKKDVHQILTNAGFVNYRLDGAADWIMKTIEMLWEL